DRQSAIARSGAPATTNAPPGALLPVVSKKEPQRRKRRSLGRSRSLDVIPRGVGPEPRRGSRGPVPYRDEDPRCHARDRREGAAQDEPVDEERREKRPRRQPRRHARREE